MKGRRQVLSGIFGLFLKYPALVRTPRTDPLFGILFINLCYIILHVC